MKRFVSLFVSILVSSAAGAWFFQNSIEAYWQQTYHRSSPLQFFSEHGWWRTGASLQARAYAFSDGLKAWLAEDVLEEAAAVADVQMRRVLPDAAALTAASDAAASDVLDEVADGGAPQQVVVRKGDKVFFAGDSLMQGVAPFVQKSLKRQYGLASVNLSKQSTGLSYPGFFDWPKTIEQTLAQQSDIRVLVVFLGPNDPWDFSKGRRLYKFASEEWAQEYLERVGRIVSAAEKHHVQIIWMGIPYMKNPKLDRQMRYLDKLLSDALAEKVVWLPTDKVLSNGADVYRDSVEAGGKMIRYRSKDGIHFSGEGQKLLAAKIMEKIVFEPVGIQ